VSLRTALTELLGLEVPIVQAGMGGVAGPELVAAVSRAGGLGILAGLNVPPEELRARIRQVRALTDRPFGVNLWLHADLRPPADVATIPEATVVAVQSVLNRFRARLGLPPTVARPAPVPDLVDGAIAVLLEERPPVFSTALGLPDAALVARCHARGIRVLAMVTSVADAREAEARGVDAVVAQGLEAGGHRSVGQRLPSGDVGQVATMVLVPQVVDAVRVPVVAAGGIADGRGLAAALALGASGAQLGTRFVATREAAGPEFRKKALLEADSGATVLTPVVSGLPARYLRNAFIAEYEASGAPVLPPLVQARAAEDIVAAAAAREALDYFPIAAGQSVGLVDDLPGAAEVVEAIVREARAVLAGLAARLEGP